MKLSPRAKIALGLAGVGVIACPLAPWVALEGNAQIRGARCLSTTYPSYLGKFLGHRISLPTALGTRCFYPDGTIRSLDAGADIYGPDLRFSSARITYLNLSKPDATGARDVIEGLSLSTAYGLERMP